MDKEKKKRKNLKILRNKRWKLYKTWTKCYCPALKTHIYFTVDGFFHLHTEPSGRVRKVDKQLHKFGLLSCAPIVIKNSAKTITYDKKFAPLGRKKRNGKPIIKEFEYWGLRTTVGLFRKKKVKVVVRKSVGSKKTIFWSIMK